MGINEWKDRRGKKKIYASRYWPDGTRYKRVQPNRSTAKKVLARIEESIAMGTWRDVREQLLRDDGKSNPTLSEFASDYLVYCEGINRRPDFKKQALVALTDILGHIRIKELSRSHAFEFIDRRRTQVKPPTINRGLSVLKHMMGHAVELGLIRANPLQKLRLLPETEAALRVMTLQEERHLVRSVTEVDPVVGAFVAVLGETGMRLSEGLRLTWELIDLRRRCLSVEKGKNKRARTIPITEYAIEHLQWIEQNVRRVGVPSVFLQIGTTRPWKDPRGPFHLGRELAGLPWVGFHDLRHFRATQWVSRGMDIRTVQELLGHRSITTTQRYAHFASGHARDSVERISRDEVQELNSSEFRTTG